ncbi:MAG: HPr family phosphocarrier protein [Planctomycetota bacterium]
MIEVEDEIQVSNLHGIHVRPATRLAETARKFTSKIIILAKGRDVDAKSILALMTLGAESGTVLRVRATGDDAADAVKAILELIRGRFGEE